MKFLGRHINDLLQLQGRERSLDEDRFYIQTVGTGGKLVPTEQLIKPLDELLQDAANAYNKEMDERIN